VSRIHRFRNIATYWSKIAEKTYPTLIWRPLPSEPPGISA